MKALLRFRLWMLCGFVVLAAIGLWLPRAIEARNVLAILAEQEKELLEYTKLCESSIKYCQSNSKQPYEWSVDRDTAMTCRNGAPEFKSWQEEENFHKENLSTLEMILREHSEEFREFRRQWSFLP